MAPPGPPVLAQALKAAGEAVDAAAIAEELLERDELASEKVLLTICSALIARRGGPIPQSHDEHVVFHVPWSILREVIAGLPEDRRDAVLVRLIGKPGNENAARVQMRYTLPVLDLATGDGAKAAIAAMRKHLEGKQEWARSLQPSTPEVARPSPATAQRPNAAKRWSTG